MTLITYLKSTSVLAVLIIHMQTVLLVLKLVKQPQLTMPIKNQQNHPKLKMSPTLPLKGLSSIKPQLKASQSKMQLSVLYKSNNNR